MTAPLPNDFSICPITLSRDFAFWSTVGVIAPAILATVPSFASSRARLPSTLGQLICLSGQTLGVGTDSRPGRSHGLWTVGLSWFHLWMKIPNTCSKSGIRRATRRESSRCSAPGSLEPPDGRA
jgi:hypothetical protein